jgi:hypothetical protein
MLLIVVILLLATAFPPAVTITFQAQSLSKVTGHDGVNDHEIYSVENAGLYYVNGIFFCKNGGITVDFFFSSLAKIFVQQVNVQN